ncbi:hypothetical protein [Scytonema sp. NUACC26]|uniref:hypothetical protein n=1 Tax=Scytonema sp. NUACC26 TaxID=3140176 RepID=UPI0038B3DE58
MHTLVYEVWDCHTKAMRSLSDRRSEFSVKIANQSHFPENRAFRENAKISAATYQNCVDSV